MPPPGIRVFIICLVIANLFTLAIPLHWLSVDVSNVCYGISMFIGLVGVLWPASVKNKKEK